MNLKDFLEIYTTPSQKIQIVNNQNYNFLDPQEFISSLQLLYDIENLIKKNDYTIAKSQVIQVKTKLIEYEEKHQDILIIKLDL